MSPAFLSGVEKQFPQAHITFDKFHVLKILNEAVEQIRREETKDRPDRVNLFKEVEGHPQPLEACEKGGLYH